MKQNLQQNMQKRIPSLKNKEIIKKHLEFEDKVDFLNLEQGAVVPTTKEEWEMILKRTTD